jgi:hypothetical protein
VPLQADHLPEGHAEAGKRLTCQVVAPVDNGAYLATRNLRVRVVLFPRISPPHHIDAQTCHLCMPAEMCRYTRDAQNAPVLGASMMSLKVSMLNSLFFRVKA